MNHSLVYCEVELELVDQWIPLTIKNNGFLCCFFPPGGGGNGGGGPRWILAQSFSLLYIFSPHPLFFQFAFGQTYAVHTVLTLSFFLLACLLAEAKLACILLF